jgi:Rrf2 family protein
MFSKETEYAIRSLVYIKARNNEGTTPGVVEIAREIESPQFFTAKILHKLVKMGFVASRKGRNGGFYFDAKQQEVTLREVIVAIEGEKIFTGCGFGLHQCDETHPCPLHDEYAPLRDALNHLTATRTISDLATKKD